MKEAKQFGKEILVNIIAGVILLILPSIFSKVFNDTKFVIIGLQIVSIVAIIAINFVFYRFKCKKCEDKQNRLEIQRQANMINQIGIVEMLSSTIEGEGSTEKILVGCDNHFFFMGIAATKWIKGAKNFDETMKRLLARNGKVQIIMLNPMSKFAKNMSIASGKAENYLQNSIIKNMKELKTYKELGLNITVKVYSHMPIFRIAVVDDEKIYVGHYRVNSDGTSLSQIKLQGKDKILFKQFLDYCNVTWDSEELKTIDLDELDNQNYLLGLVC